MGNEKLQKGGFDEVINRRSTQDKGKKQTQLGESGPGKQISGR